jgi:hypothetical protein
MSDPSAYFERTGGGAFVATELTGGAWVEAEQHIAPMVGLVVHEIERHALASAADDDKALTRLTFDILGVIPVGPFEITVETIRPGRTIELVDAVVTAGGRPVVRARAWRTMRFDTTSVAGGVAQSMPGPEETPDWAMTDLWPGGFIRSLRIRRDASSVPGRGRAWMQATVPLVAGETVSPTAAFLALVDTANGMTVRESPKEWLFPNLDLSIHLHRTPVAGPTGLDTTVTFGADGLGLTEAVLHDVRGPVGRLAQTLTVRRRPPRAP